MKIFLSIFIIFSVSSLLLFLNFMSSKSNLYSSEKSSAFECGFNNFKSSRLPFSINFFIISTIFLIFDVEIVLVLPLIPSFNFLSFINWFMAINFFFFIIIYGLFIEWNNKALDWIF